MGLKKLSKTANRFNVKLVDDSLTSLKAGNKSVEIATVDGVANIPATAYHRGVDVGVVNYEAAGGELESGEYMLRLTTADEVRERGHHTAVAEFVDAQGRTASRQKIELEVTSTEVPARRIFDNAAFSLESRFSEDMVGGFDPAFIIIVFWCSNGTHGIIVLV